MARTRNIIGSALRGAAWAALVAAVAFAAVATVLPKVSEYRTVVITGRSMTESMPIGSLALVQPVRDTDVRVGDVITFDHPDGSGARVTHRVTKVATAKDGTPVFRTKGDHNETADSWRIQYVDRTAWRAVWDAPQLGNALLVLQSPAARFVLVFAPVSILLLLTMRSIWARPTTTAPRNAKSGGTAQ